MRVVVNRHKYKYLCLLVVLFGLAMGGLQGCSGGGKGGQPNDKQAPLVAIHFPPARSLTQGSDIVVRGSATDDSAIESVRVNGVEAASTDNFVTWSVKIPLVAGLNTLIVETTDVLNNVDHAAAQVAIESGPRLNNARRMNLDVENNRLLVLGVSVDETQIISIDMESGARGMLFRNNSFSMGADNLFYLTQEDFAFDRVGNRILLIDEPDDLTTLSSIALATGEQSIITKDTLPLPDNTPLLSPNAVVVDGVNDRVFVLDSGAEAIVAVNLKTGERGILSNNTTPDSNIPFFRPAGIALDADNKRLLVLGGRAFQQADIIAVDIATGARRIFSDSNTPDSVSFGITKGIVVDGANGRALVADSTFGIIAADLATGRRTVFNSTRADAIALDSKREQVIITRTGPRSLTGIGLNTGVATVLSDDNPPIPNADVPLVYPVAVTVHNDSALVLNSPNFGANPDIVKVNLLTGIRTVFSNGATPDVLNEFASPGNIELDAARNRVLVTDAAQNAIIGVDLVSGARSVVLDNSEADTTNTLMNVSSMALDAANNRVLVLDTGRDALIGINLSTGAREVISDRLTPDAAHSFAYAKDIVLDGENAYVIDSQRRSLIRVNLTTGARTVVSGTGQPDNNSLFSNIEALVLDTDNERALIADWLNGKIFTANLSTGARDVLSGDGKPDFVNDFLRAQDIVLDRPNNRALIIDPGRDAVMSMNLDTGVRKFFVTVHTPDDKNTMTSPRDIVMDRPQNRALLLNSDGLMLGVDLDNGARSTLSSATVPDAVNVFVSPRVMAMDSDKKRVFVLDENLDALLAVDSSTGARSVLSDDTTVGFNYPRTMVHDRDNKRVLVLDGNAGAIISIDLESGLRSIFSDNNNPDINNPFGYPSDMVLDSAKNRILVFDDSPGRLIAVNLTTGERSYLETDGFGDGDLDGPNVIAFDADRGSVFILSTDGNGAIVLLRVGLSGGAVEVVSTNASGENRFEDPAAIVFDAENNRILALDKGIGAVLAVDLKNGQRVILSK